MGWEDRRYEAQGGGGGFRAVVRRIFGDGENPLNWAVPLYTAWGIKVRAHILFVLMIAIELIQAIRRDQMGLPYVAIGLASLWLLVLLHEYGHCIACRRVGGSATEILMWPLGGLASCRPPHNWKADLITTIGGPGVNAILWPVLGVVLLALGQKLDAILFNPFKPWLAIGNLTPAPGMYWVVLTVWWFYYVNSLLFCFNMLLPMYPMDCGRVIHAILWRKLGHRKATSIVVVLGFVTAVILLFIAVNTSSMTLLGIALFGAWVCYQERRQLAMTTDDMSAFGYNFDEGYKSLNPDEESHREKARKSKEKEEREDQAELDRILAKIASSGMDSLTKSEKRWLQRDTQRRRAQ